MLKKPEDFQEVYELFLKDVYGYSLYLTGDPHLAEELTQETFFKALRNFSKFKGTCKVNVWLFQIAKNTYYSQIKYQKRFTDSSSLPETESASETLEENMIRQENLLTLHKLLHKLADPYKEVFHLRTFAELSFIQIGHLFGKSESWARVTYYRARQQLQQQIKEGQHHESDE